MLNDSMTYADIEDTCIRSSYKNCKFRGSYGICHKGAEKCPYISGDSGKEAHREEGRDGELIGTLAEQGDI